MFFNLSNIYKTPNFNPSAQGSIMPKMPGKATPSSPPQNMDDVELTPAAKQAIFEQNMQFSQMGQQQQAPNMSQLGGTGGIMNQLSGMGLQYGQQPYQQFMSQKMPRLSGLRG